VGDQNGLHVLRADSAQAYKWHTVATLGEAGFASDEWVGNYCLTDSNDAIVVYAPRDFTNEQPLMETGAFTAVVNLTTGKTKKLPITASLAYFDPSCNSSTRTAVLTQMNDKAGKTRLVTVNADGRILSTSVVAGEITSAVPTTGGIVAARGDRLLEIRGSAPARPVATTLGTAFSLRVDSGGGVVFGEQYGAVERVRRLSGAKVSTLATGVAGQIGIESGSSGRVFLTGTPKPTGTLPSGVSRVPVAATGELSTEGGLAVDTAISSALPTHVTDPLARRTTDTKAPIDITAQVSATGKTVRFVVANSTTSSSGGTSPALSAGMRAQKASGTSSVVRPNASASDATSTIESDRACSVPRNDPTEQAYQPTPNQVVWAVDMAIRGDLHSQWINQGGWRSTDGLGTVDPQSMFPLPALVGGGRIPAQVLLGILSQESNLWQAEGGALPGQTGNPLTGNWYGNPPYDASAPAGSTWQINWSKSDCGYGIGQVTDGMRVGQTTLSGSQQQAIALDYTANIAEAASILASKWNELQSLSTPLTINNDSASKIEDWFAAVWDYNEGFNAPGSDPSGAWGLGWYNNPANPIYPPTRHPFLDNNTFSDAAHPQYWPYQEKVLGWAAWSIDTGRSYDDSGNLQSPGASGYNTAGFAPAWWDTTADRTLVKPPLTTFCSTTVNACDVNNPPPCETQQIQNCDYLHWWNQPATWKTDCSTSCGHETLTYVTLRSEPGDGKTSTPDCTTSSLPSGAWVIDSVSGQVPPMVDGCSRTWTDSGTLSFSFNPDSAGEYEGKEDLHQIGGGLGGHFWYAHTRSNDAEGTNMEVKGTWTFNQPYNGFLQIDVHLPDTGAQTGDAVYEVDTATGPQYVTLSQASTTNHWAELGEFKFNGAPVIRLTNITADGTGDQDIAWDAVAAFPGQQPETVVTYAPNSTAADIDYTADGPLENVSDLTTVGMNYPQAVRPLATGPTGLAAHTTSTCADIGRRTGLAPCILKSTKLAIPRTVRPSTSGTSFPSWCASTARFTRFETCAEGTITMIALNSSGASIGTSTFEVSQDIATLKNAPVFDDSVYITPLSIDSSLGAVTLAWQANCSGACSTSAQDSYGSPTWTSGDTHQAFMHVSHSWTNTTGQNAMNLSWSMELSSTGPTPGAATYNWSAPSNMEVRCDAEVGSGAGCVFDKYIAGFTVNTAKYPSASAFYWVTEEKLASHPGARNYQKPLHRLADETAKAANRAKICDSTFSPRPETPSPSCDEYPFAASYESGGQLGITSGSQCAQFYANPQAANSGQWELDLDDRYLLPAATQVWPQVCGRANIPLDQNTGVGGDLGRFVSAQRLLDGDAYYVDPQGFDSCSNGAGTPYCTVQGIL
jgi:hypothetical protein